MPFLGIFPGKFPVLELEERVFTLSRRKTLFCVKWLGVVRVLWALLLACCRQRQRSSTRWQMKVSCVGLTCLPTFICQRILVGAVVLEVA